MDLPSFPHVDMFAAGINALYGALPPASRRTTVATLSWGC